ncbi:MAG: hypothetical protein JXR03_06820 [Cyclobacteriaceae bacterium]
MGLRDFLVTPIYFLLFSLIAFVLKPIFTTKATAKYFLPALWVKFIGAISLGVIYQFYYGGGDTLNYFTHGSRWIWEAFLDDTNYGIELLLDSGGFREPGPTFKYSSRIWYFRDPHSYAIVRIAAFFDLFTFHTYTATALFFAVFSFSGLWAFFSAVSKKYGDSKWIALAILFVPSTVFWGSGILKDTITLGALGWLTWCMISLIDLREKKVIYFLVAFLAAYLIYSIKVYILLCYLPTISVWLYWKNQLRVKNFIVKVIVAPILISFFCLLGYFILQQISSVSGSYSIDSIAKKAAVTANDIRYGWGARAGGEGGYDLGVLDGSWQSMISLLPQAINVSLFRPYLWEVKTPLMLLTAIESLIMLILTIKLVFSYRRKLIFNDSFLVFCFVFSLLFAFAVGVSTYNFGTLMRYKIPMIPFYGILIAVGQMRRSNFDVENNQID